MQYPKLTVFFAILVIVLGQAAVVENSADSVLFRTAATVRDATMPVMKRIDWRITRWQADRGDACAIGRVAAAHFNGYRMVDFEYSGLAFDREKARELFIRSAELGCDFAREAVLIGDVTWPDPLAPYRDDTGRVDWQAVAAAASTGDPDARYFVASTMKRSRAQARMRGIEYDPERGTDMLRQLAREGHLDALMDLAQNGPGIPPELNRAYYALMDTTWKPMPTLRIHMRYLEIAIEHCSPTAWAKAMDIWSTMSAEMHTSEATARIIGGAHEQYLTKCSGPAIVR